MYAYMEVVVNRIVLLSLVPLQSSLAENDSIQSKMVSYEKPNWVGILGTQQDERKGTHLFSH